MVYLVLLIFVSFSTPQKGLFKKMTNALISVALSTIGQDKPGLVSALTQALTTVQGNIADSTMTRLGGQFAMILLLELPTEAAWLQFRQALLGLEERLGLTFTNKRLPQAVLPAHLVAHNPAEKPHRSYLVSVAGRDKTGITFEVSTVLAGFEANITDLNAHSIAGEGGMVYILVVEFDCPKSVPHQVLDAELQALGTRLSLEVRLRSVDAIAL
jgi:glycine cleavage system transcriptional repressor